MTVAALLLLWLAHPLTWGATGPLLWSPPAGLGLALVAWFGWRTGTGLLACSGALLLIHALLRWLLQPSADLLGAAEGVLGVAGPVLAWWLYHSWARGSRRLLDPRSATQFVLLVPGVAAVAVALGQTLLAWPAGEPLAPMLLRCWLAEALGFLVVAPPLLVLVTPWLLRHGLIPVAMQADRVGDPDRIGVVTASSTPDGAITPSAGEKPSHWGEWLELAGLAFGASVLCLLMSGVHGRELLGWQLWGLLLLLIVWASLRQGLRGGTLVAAVASALPLVLRQAGGGGMDPLLQAHLLAQCGAALLVSSASTWVRLNETGYRQVVAHIPVVIYSARLPRRMGNGEWGMGNERQAPAPSHSPFEGVEIVLVSAASQRLLGCPAEELLGDYRRWLSCVHQEDHEVLLAALVQLARQDQPVTCEYRLAGTEPGSSRLGLGPGETARKARWLRDTLAPHRDTEGRLIGWEGVVTDITEQRALADDLRRTTSMFNALVANLPTGVFFIHGKHGRPIVVNARARQLLGQREDASAGLDHLSRVYRLFRPDGALYPVEELPVYQALRQGRTTMCDNIVVHRPDGRKVPLVTWAAPVQLRARGEPDAAVWVLEDLTALHQAEAARKDTEGRFRAVIETMAEGLVVLDGRGRVVSSNPAASAFFGVEADRLRERSLLELGWSFVREDGSPLPAEEHPAQQALRTARPVRNFLLGAAPFMKEEEGKDPSDSSFILHPSSFTRWLLVNAVPLAGGGAAPAGVVWTFSDLSAYVQAREAIRASEERYRSLVENLPLMLIQSDRDLRLTYINPATQQITGYSLDELAEPAMWGSMVHPDDLPRVAEMARKALAGQSDRGELRYRAKDGSEKVAFALSQPRFQDGQVVGATTLMVDVTRERQLERELQRSQRLELIGRLSSGVAHDFNNLLAVVLNLADLARGNLPFDHPVHADLRRISEASKQAANLAGQLLTLGRHRSGGTRRIDINLVVRRTLDLLRATLPASIRIEADLPEEELVIQADETQVQQVLMNLCLNARDAMPRGGLLRVATRATEGGVLLTVEDSGTGMSEELRGRIFEPFFSTKEGGTGLGLAVVAQIVESYGGRIDVVSQPGRGARFDVRWPAAVGAPPTAIGKQPSDR